MSDLTLFDQSVEAEIADLLGTDEDTILDVFGAGWRLAPRLYDYDGDPTGGLADVSTLYGPWYLSGEPPQVMLRVTHEYVEVAMPVGRRVGDLVVWDPADTRFLSLTEWTGLRTRVVLEEFAARRREVFRYCRVCRALTGPEERHGANICTVCTGRLLAAPG